MMAADVSQSAKTVVMLAIVVDSVDDVKFEPNKVAGTVTISAKTLQCWVSSAMVPVGATVRTTASCLEAANVALTEAVHHAAGEWS